MCEKEEEPGLKKYIVSIFYNYNNYRECGDGAEIDVFLQFLLYYNFYD